jgi:uncharacterized membrane protein YGL010W
MQAEEAPMALMRPRTGQQWLTEYADSHRHPINRFCHTIGIPLVLGGVLLGVASLLASWLWPLAAGSFLVGWVFQFVGHAYEGKPPEFTKDPRFLFVGVRWWWAKVRGQL